MAYFDFLRELAAYTDDMVTRMDRRHGRIVAPFHADLAGARVLDLAAHDGRWSFALAEHAAQVIGVEARGDLIARFADFPAGPVRDRITLVQDDIYIDLDRRIAAQDSFDVVAMFGIYYHVMDHYGLLARVTRLRPKLVIIDSEFIIDKNPMIAMVRERTDNPLNAIAQVPGQIVTLKGVPSIGAMARMAEVLGYDCDWVPWNALPAAERGTVNDYFREGRMQRRTCVLRPVMG